MKLIALLSAVMASVSHVLAQDTGRYTIHMNNAVTCIHTFALPNQKVLCIERPHVAPYPVNPFTDGYTVTESNIKTKELVVIPAVRNMFCAGHAQMADGNILVIGGDFPVGHNSAGEVILQPGITARRTLRVCQPTDVNCQVSAWEYHEDMFSGRWYPTVTTLYTGNNIIISGSLKNLDFTNLSATNNPTYEYFPSKPGNWPRTMAALDWAYPWNLYPAVFQLHNKNVLMFVANRTVIIDPVTDAMDESIPDILLDDKYPWIYPNTPTFVMLPLTKKNGYKSEVMACGGSRMSLNADDRCISINFADEKPEWKLKTTMPVGRLMPDSVLLPDGTVFFSNGAAYGLAGGDAGDARNAYGPIFVNHIYDPETNKWYNAGTMQVARLYHSGAILLEDGSVLITGSEEQNYPDVVANRTDCFPYVPVACTSPFEYRMERYEPPYLLTSTERPVIANAPTKVSYDSTFGVQLSTSGSNVNKAVFIRYSTTTHSTNTDQRYLELDIIGRNASYLLLQAPVNGSIAPPGNYHLFILNNGVPSIAKTVLFGEGARTEGEKPLNPLSNVGSSSMRLGVDSSSILMIVVMTILSVYLF